MRFKFNKNERSPLHITGKTQKGWWADEDMGFVWSVFSQTIQEIQTYHAIETHAFVLMGNHYHWICTCTNPQDPIFFEYFEDVLNISLLEKLKLSQTLTGSPHIQLVENFSYYLTLYRYVYRNPVSAGLSAKAHKYPYSTLPYLLGKKGLEFDVRDNMNLIADPFKTLQFINSPNCPNFEFGLLKPRTDCRL